MSIKMNTFVKVCWKGTRLFFQFLLIGLPVGVIIGLSESPVISTVLSSILVLITTLVALFSGFELNSSRISGKLMTLPVLGLIWGLLVGGFLGLMEKNSEYFIHHSQAPDIEQWVKIMQPNLSYKLLYDSMEAVSKRDHKRFELLKNKILIDSINDVNRQKIAHELFQKSMNKGEQEVPVKQTEFFKKSSEKFSIYCYYYNLSLTDPEKFMNAVFKSDDTLIQAISMKTKERTKLQEELKIHCENDK